MEIYLQIIGVLLHVVVLILIPKAYLAVREDVLNDYYIIQDYCIETVYKPEGHIPKWTKFFTIGIRIIKQRLYVGRWYKYKGDTFKVIHCEYRKWNEARIIMATSPDYDNSISLFFYQKEIDSMEQVEPVPAQPTVSPRVLVDEQRSENDGRWIHQHTAYTPAHFRTRLDDIWRGYSIVPLLAPKKIYPQRKKKT